MHTTRSLPWYRIDKTDVSLLPVPHNKAAYWAFQLFGLGASDALDAGRFQTPWAFYVRADRLTDSERALPATIGPTHG